MTQHVLASLPIDLQLVEGHPDKDVFRTTYPMLVGDIFAIYETAVVVAEMISISDGDVVFRAKKFDNTASLDAIRLVLNKRQLHHFTPPSELPFLQRVLPKPKTDLERFVELYSSFGIECVVEPITEKGDVASQITLSYGGYEHEGMTESPFFGGYNGFCTEIHFDADGKFLSQHFYEH